MGNVKLPTYPIEDDACGQECACEEHIVDAPSNEGSCGCCCDAPSVIVFTAPIDEFDYAKIINKPSIEDVELVGNREMSEFGLGIATNEQIESLFG